MHALVFNLYAIKMRSIIQYIVLNGDTNHRYLSVCVDAYVVGQWKMLNVLSFPRIHTYQLFTNSQKVSSICAVVHLFIACRESWEMCCTDDDNNKLHLHCMANGDDKFGCTE